MAGYPKERDVLGWGDELEAVAGRLARFFTRKEPRKRAVCYVRGLLGNAERKNGWQLAEEMGDATPDGVQHLLLRACWDADAVRDELLRYAAASFGHPDGVLIVDETGFLKKDSESAGVSRQYSGTAGGSKIRKSACSWVMPVKRVGCFWIGICISRKNGRRT